MNNNKEKKDRELTYFNHNSFGNPHTQYISNNKNFALRPYEMIKGTYYNVLTLLLDDKVANRNTNNQFQICFNVYDNCNYGVENDDIWELFLKVGNSNPDMLEKNGSVMTKLKGKERRALVTLKKETIQKEVRIDYDNGSHEIKYEPLEKIRINLYIKMDYDTRLVMKFMNTNIEDKFIIIHDRNYAITKDEIDKINETKIYSRTDNGVIEYNQAESDDGIRFLKLFDLDNSFKNNPYIDYFGVFELYTHYDIMRRSTFNNKYVKFSISCSNNGNGKEDYEVSFQILNSKNVNKEDLFVTRSSDGILSVWFTDAYPSKVKMIPIINNDIRYRVFKINEEDNKFIKETPKNYDSRIIDGKSFY